MIKSTNTIGSLVASMAMCSLNIYTALTENDIKLANQYIGMLAQIRGNYEAITKLIKAEGV